MVLFKCMFRGRNRDSKGIYIPLWSYSNGRKVAYLLAETQFTFHYGPIQIRRKDSRREEEKRFTFHYGPIQILRRLTSGRS